MATESTVQTVYAFAALSAVPLGYLVWQHRDRPGALPLLGSLVGSAWWAGGLFVLTLDLPYVVAEPLLRSLMVASALITLSVAIFALEYTGREEHVTRRTVAALAVHPAAIATLAFVNPGNLVFVSIGPDPTRAIGIGIEWGLGALLHLVYSYVVLAFVTVLVVDMLLRTRSLYRGQVAVLIAALLAPVLPNLLHFYGPISFDTTPVGFLVANALYAVAITRYRFVDLVPIARDRVLDNVTDAVYVVDAEDRVIDANDAARAISGDLLAQTDLIGEDVEALLAPVPAALETYRDLVADRREQSVSISIAGRHYDVDASPIDDGRGRHVGWLFLVRDVTEREEREAELRRRNEQLDRFASVVSHDLRNPLGIAKGFVEVTRETGDVERLEEVERSHDRMETIIEDVLALARDGATVTDVEPVSLRDLAERAWRNVDHDGATLDVPEDATLRADGDRTTRLLENLFRNAMEHGSATPGSHVEHDTPNPGSRTRQAAVEDGAGSGKPPTVEVRPCEGGFYVADDGPGIPESERESVLESGYSGGDGTGFGLAVVRQIADAHGWAVAVDESPSGGARFTFTGVDRER